MKMRIVACAALIGSLLAAADRKPTPQAARKFIDDAEQKLLALGW
jgi:hypothetical protein